MTGHRSLVQLPEASGAATAARYCAYAFLVTMPWAAVFAERFNPHDVARLFESLVMVFAAWAWWQGTAQHGARPCWERSGLLAIAALAIASTVMAAHPAYAALESSAAVLLLMVTLVFARTHPTMLRRELPPVLALASLMSVVMELPRLAFFLSDGRAPVGLDFGFMYMNPRFLNHAQSLILPLSFVPLLVPARRWVRVAAWVGLCGGLALLWRTGGRGTLIAFGAFSLALPWLLRDRATQAIRLLAGALSGAAIAYALLFFLPGWLMALPIDQQDSAGERLTGFTDSGRLYLWHRAAQGVLQNPWLGVGPMHFAHGANPVAAHPHNSLAQLAVEWGLLATALVLAAAAIAARRALRGLKANELHAEARPVLAVATLAAMAGCIDSMVSGTLVMPVSQMWWWVALGVALAAVPPAVASTAPRSGRWRLSAAAGLVILHIALSAATYQRSTQPAADAAGTQRTNVPRYWINGFF